MKRNVLLPRRDFLRKTGAALAGSVLAGPFEKSLRAPGSKMRVALVGTGLRGVSMWGKDVVDSYGDTVEFVGLCDINPGRVAMAKEWMGVVCPVFTDFEAMMHTTRPEWLIVTTVDATHSEFIIRGMEMGTHIITEKPLTTDEHKCQAILEAEKRTGKKVIVTFNYRYAPHRQKLYELLRSEVIGKVTSADFHWYLDIHHGADYFRRWHRLRAKSGSLLVHKATHHFDLLNWWLESEPEEVFAYGGLNFYGKNGAFRSTHCRACPHKKDCQFYWDIYEEPYLKKLYVDNEQYDGYLRDGCVFREDIDIFDKMAAQIKYANGVQVSYSLTAYAPYEGYRIAFNGTKGRLEAWIQESVPQGESKPEYDEIVISRNFGEVERIRISNQEEGHGGGDARLKDSIFKSPLPPDPYRQSAGTRDGAMSILIGIAARNSIDTAKPVKISTLTELAPLAKRL